MGKASLFRIFSQEGGLFIGSLQVILGLRVGVLRGSPWQNKVWKLDSRRALDDCLRKRGWG